RDIPHEVNHPTRPLVADIEGKLSGFTDTPKLTCWGLRDFCFSEHFIDQWRVRFPDLQEERFADAGHYLLEDATDECIPRIVAFLRNA
ncbi:MAG: alpha/beta hydrolase, partial [Opitutae bacterium]|nr:alpha/beta hydrolase [Opitutae bacterium]